VIDPSDYVFAAALLLVIGCNIFFGTRLMRESTKMQWRLTAGADRHVPTWLAVWGGPILMIAVRFLIWFGSVFTPLADFGVQILIVMFWVIFATAHISMLLNAR